MAALEARMAARGAQIPNAKSQPPKGSTAEVVEEEVVERVVPGLRSFSEGGPDALGSGADAPWPGMADEASFLADQRGQGIVPPAAPANEPTDLSPLPSLEELVQRIPAEARAALDDLFRAKFTGVRRVSKKSLKT